MHVDALSPVRYFRARLDEHPPWYSLSFVPRTMSAIVREECEATVLTHEAIEVHLSYLRPAVEALGQRLDQANKDRAAGDALLGEKIDQANKDRAAGDALLGEKIDQANKDRAAGDALLGEKIDQANKDRAAGDAMLAEKIDKTNEKIDQTSKDLTDRISKIQGSLDGLKWFIGSVALILSGLSIAHDLGWI